MSSSYFYSNIEIDEHNEEVISAFNEYSTERALQVYIINKPLGDNKYAYSSNNTIVVLVPKHKIGFIALGDQSQDIEDYYEDFIEDLGIISDKYEYKKILGRPKTWKDSLTKVFLHKESGFLLDEYLEATKVADISMQKKIELLISLLTGSINDIERVKENAPLTLLEKIKQKIVLFDGDQTRFIYEKLDKKVITIQGLSGTGKTELLLHKIKEIYLRPEETKILFTCHNKILADSLRNRLPAFFNFMKVEKQIKWNERLFCFHAWGSDNNIYSGTYRYICSKYNIPFERYSKFNSFDSVCERALKIVREAKANSEIEFAYAFDYSFIDESQDFMKNFVDLIEAVTKYSVYVAGDVFQSIFQENIGTDISPDYLLSKCYRTDPKTLMFAHALGMGLLEAKKLRWLDDKQWKACGYQFSNNNGFYTLSRDPLRRFEDLSLADIKSVSVVHGNSLGVNEIEQQIIELIDQLLHENETIKPEDIAIIFIDDDQTLYYIADKIEYSISERFGWEINKAWESKQAKMGSILLSNRNNVKGLEFPFVICVTRKITDSYSYRNSLYTMLTRSFIKSTLFITNSISTDLLTRIAVGLEQIYNNGSITVKEPSEKEKVDILTRIKEIEHKQSLYEIFDGICIEIGIDKKNRDKLVKAYKSIYSDQIQERSIIREWIHFNYVNMSK